jgi:hypothetical protein
MQMSDTIAALATALAQAQGEIDDAAKAAINPAFGKGGSKYADLASVRAVIRGPLSKNGLSVVQLPRAQSGLVEVDTMLIHKTGEYISETLRMPVNPQQMNAHGIGSAITYARRYGLMSILCLAADDDDGNGAVIAAPVINTRQKEFA